MHFVFDKVRQLEHVDHPHRHRLVINLASFAIEQAHLAIHRGRLLGFSDDPTNDLLKFALVDVVGNVVVWGNMLRPHAHTEVPSVVIAEITLFRA